MRVRVRLVVPGCWEVVCPCRPARPVVAQVGSWERAMLRAADHVREVHDESGLVPDRQVAAACRALYSRWTWGWMRGGERPDHERLHHELYWALMGEVLEKVGRVLTSSDPCPPAGAVVRDDCGQRWVNSGCYPSAWMPADGDGDSESWTKIAGNYGPVTVLEWGDDV